MEIRRAKPGEGKILSDLAMRSKAYWGYDESFIEACREALTITEKNISGDHVYVLDADSVVLGFFCLIKSGEKGQLDSLFIDPKYIGKGYGKLMWKCIFMVSREIGLKEFTIDADPHAEEFYKKMGAVRIGEVESTVFKGRELPFMKVIIHAD